MSAMKSLPPTPAATRPAIGASSPPAFAGATTSPAAADRLVVGPANPAAALGLQLWANGAMQRALVASNISWLSHRTMMAIINNIGR